MPALLATHSPFTPWGSISTSSRKELEYNFPMRRWDVPLEQGTPIDKKPPYCLIMFDIILFAKFVFSLLPSLSSVCHFRIALFGDLCCWWSMKKERASWQFMSICSIFTALRLPLNLNVACVDQSSRATCGVWQTDFFASLYLIFWGSTAGSMFHPDNHWTFHSATPHLTKKRTHVASIFFALACDFTKVHSLQPVGKSVSLINAGRGPMCRWPAIPGIFQGTKIWSLADFW